jgi:hypothetical protein
MLPYLFFLEVSLFYTDKYQEVGRMGGGGMAIKKSRKTSSNNTTPLLPIFHLSYFHRAGGVWTRSAQVKAHREIAT